MKPLRSDEEVLEKLVDLARVSSCGGNKQPLRYYLASTPDVCEETSPHIAWAAALEDWSGPAEGYNGRLVI